MVYLGSIATSAVSFSLFISLNMFQFHPDQHFSFEVLRSLGATRYFGGDISEQLSILSHIPAGDFEAWHREWSGLANRVLATIDESKLDLYSPATIRDVYFRASHYQFISDLFLHGKPSDLRSYENYKLSRKWFDIANLHLPIPGKHVKIETEYGFYVPAIIYRTASASATNPRPTVIVHGGFDSSLEELMHFFGFAALEREYNVVIFEGPGQLGVVHEQNKGWEPKWERVVSPVIDHIFAHSKAELAYIDPTRIGLIGMSLGGFLAARAAAFEPRLAALILIDGVWNFEDAIWAKFPHCKDAWDAGEESKFNENFNVSSASPTGQRWAYDQLLWSARSHNAYEVMQNVVKPMDLEGVASKINMPVFVGLAENEAFFDGQPEKVAAGIGSNATLVRFDDALGAGAHCAVGAFVYQNQRIFEWFAGVVGK